MRKLAAPVSAFLLSLVLFVPGLRAEDVQDTWLKIQALPDQNTVAIGMMFLVNAQVMNSGSEGSAEFWANSCSYEKHWVTDNAAVIIQPWTCRENTLEQVTLDPGNTYQKNLILYVPKQEKTGPVTFRLGFKRMSENGDVAEPLWSDPVTMTVTVPEGATDVSPVADADAAAGLPEQASMPAGVASPEVPAPPAASDGQAEASVPDDPAQSPSSVFRDTGVPIRIRPGDEFSIVLGSNPTTGFMWKMTLPEGQRVVESLGSEYVSSNATLPGAPGEEIFRFKGAASGEIKADFVYRRPWEAKTAPLRKIFTILVEEN